MPQKKTRDTDRSNTDLRKVQNKKIKMNTGRRGQLKAQQRTVAGTPSSCRAPWFDTTIPSTPCSTAFLAISAEHKVQGNRNQYVHSKQKHAHRNARAFAVFTEIESKPLVR